MSNWILVSIVENILKALLVAVSAVVEPVTDPTWAHQDSDSPVYKDEQGSDSPTEENADETK